MNERRRMLMGKVDGYTEIAYLKSTGTQYIDTGYKPNQNTRIVCVMKTDESVPYGRFFGCVNGTSYNSTPHLCFDYESNYNGTLHVMWGTNGGWVTISNVVGDYNKHKYEIDKGAIYRDNTLVYTYTTETWQSPINLAIFNYMKSNGINTDDKEAFRGRVYSFQIYDDDVLIRDFVPVKVEGVGYLYDKVSKQLFGNQGTGDFICGPEKDNKVLMTSTTNPEVLAICYAQGWCADASYMTYGEAAEVASIGTAFKGSNIVHFDEFEHFTGLGSYSEQMFMDCSNLQRIKLPSHLTSLPYASFWRCSSLQTIDLPNTITTFSSGQVFSECGSLHITIPPLVTNITTYSFYGVGAEDAITPNENITTVREFALNYANFKNGVLYLPKIQTIYNGGFGNSNKLTEMYIGGYLNAADSIIGGCNKLQKVTIMSNISYLPTASFGSNAIFNELILNAHTAPSVGNNEFVSINYGGTLRVPIGATGYDSGAWADLVNNKGWTIVYQDIWPRKYSYVTNQWTEFTRVEYLECNRNQWINLGFAPRNGMAYYIDATPYRTSDDTNPSCLIFSDIEFSTNNRTEITFNTLYGSYYRVAYGSSKTSGGGVAFNQRHLFVLSKNGLTVDDNQAFTFDPAAEYDSNYAKQLKLLNGDYTYNGRIYSFKIEENGSTIMDLVPGRFGNSVGCMYDKISGKLFYSNGTQPFACGPDLT